MSRGGAPTGRAIAAAPAGSIRGQFRVTEQGEVVSFKYANRGTAAYQVELLGASVVEHMLRSPREAALVPVHEFHEAMEALSGTAWSAYRGLMETPGMLAYLQQSSPLEELSLLNIGSRPARRTQAQTLERSARHSVGVRVDAEPPHAVRLVRRRQRHQGVSRRAQGARARSCCGACSARRGCSG